MDIDVSIKLVFAVIACILVVVGGFLPYIRDIYRGKTKPHAYTWLIWTITQGTALVGLWQGHGGLAVVAMAIGVSMSIFVIGLSFRYGTRNITRADTIILIASLLAIGVWWQLHNPLLALVMVSLIDIVGYIPSIRKTYEEPWTETSLTWGVFIITNVLIMLSLDEYNFMTLFYLVSITAANAILLSICLVRRRSIHPR